MATIADSGIAYADTTPPDSQSFVPYDQWGKPDGSYTTDVRTWGYTAPERCAGALLSASDVGRLASTPNLRVFDAGCGNGLLAPVFREKFAGIAPKITITGFDLSQGMLEGAKDAGYDALAVGSLDAPLDYPDGSFEMVACVGTTSYLTAGGCCMPEWCRVLVPGGLAVFTIRGPYTTSPPYYEEVGWKATMDRLCAEGAWEPVSESEDVGYLPDHPEFGVGGSSSLAYCRVFVYRKL